MLQVLVDLLASVFVDFQVFRISTLNEHVQRLTVFTTISQFPPHEEFFLKSQSEAINDITVIDVICVFEKMLTSTFAYNLASTKLKSFIFHLYKIHTKTNILD